MLASPLAKAVSIFERRVLLLSFARVVSCCFSVSGEEFCEVVHCGGFSFLDLTVKLCLGDAFVYGIV